MLFQKKMPPKCSYCASSITLDKESAMCVKKGIVPATYSCRHFRYDPLRRVPPRPVTPDFSRLSKDDFTL